MQPYFLPYLGYIQLMSLVDDFVIYDDVNYINRGWINRNYILVNGQKNLLTIPLREASQNKKINEIYLSNDLKWIDKQKRTVEMAYKKAPYFEEVFELYCGIVDFKGDNLSVFLANQLKCLKDYLGIKAKLILSSESFSNQELKKGDRLIDICHQMNQYEYINPIGGAEIYTKEQFAERDVELRFLEMTVQPYEQIKTDSFIPYLSVLDVLMMNSKEFITGNLLKQFNLK